VKDADFDSPSDARRDEERPKCSLQTLQGAPSAVNDDAIGTGNVWKIDNILWNPLLPVRGADWSAEQPVSDHAV